MIPISQTAGILHLVDGAIPLFSIFKDYASREERWSESDKAKSARSFRSHHHRSSSSSSSNPNSVPPPGGGGGISIMKNKHGSGVQIKPSSAAAVHNKQQQLDGKGNTGIPTNTGPAAATAVQPPCFTSTCWRPFESMVSRRARSGKIGRCRFLWRCTSSWCGSHPRGCWRPKCGSAP